MRANNRIKASAQTGDNGNSSGKPMGSHQGGAETPLTSLIARVPQPPFAASASSPVVPAAPAPMPVQPPVIPPAAEVDSDSDVPEAFGVGSRKAAGSSAMAGAPSASPVSAVPVVEFKAADPACPLPMPLPTDLTCDPQDFWRTAGNLQDLCPPSPLNNTTALARLGQPPFPRSGFPLMGFLATLFQHISHYAGEVLKPPGSHAHQNTQSGNLPPDPSSDSCETV